MLSNVTKVVFDTQGRSENALTVYNKDFAVYSFQAASLSKHQWIALKQHLETLGIEVTDENNFAEQVTPAGKKRTKLLRLSFAAYFLYCIVGITLTEMACLSEVATKIIILLISILGIGGMLLLYLFLVRKYIEDNDQNE